MRREALACRASVLIASLSFDCKSGRPSKYHSPFHQRFRSRPLDNQRSEIVVREVERSGFYRQLHGKVGS